MFIRLKDIKDQKEVYSYGKVILRRKNYYIIEDNGCKVIIKCTTPIAEQKTIRFYGINNQSYINIIFTEEINININLLQKIVL